ncbi:MAG: nucleotidyltransferase domain-containing protein, partial [Lentisphaeria bacterium]|nr:nucleotidyltransferase domain-containing protein [Lentisphaeria bacterium]
MCQLDRLHSLRREIYEIARKHKAEKVYVFGSCARKEETPDSDVDFLVDL